MVGRIGLYLVCQASLLLIENFNISLFFKSKIVNDFSPITKNRVCHFWFTILVCLFRREKFLKLN